MGDKLGIYDYLAFIAPGSAVIATVVYGFEIARVSTPPGGEAVVMLTLAAFVVGHLLAAVGNALQPLAFGQRPFTRLSPSEGLFGDRGQLAGTTEAAVDGELAAVVPGPMTPEQRLAAAATLLRQKALDSALQTFNQQIGFYRNLTVAAFVCLGVLVAARVQGHDVLPLALWIPVAALAIVVGVVRFRRFWGYYGYEVVRGVRALRSPAAPPPAAEAD
jgi:hypothetical protein